MSITLTTNKKWDTNLTQIICILTSGKKNLGSLKASLESNNKIKLIVEKFENKDFKSASEFITIGNTQILVVPLSKKKGLDTLDKIRLTAYTSAKLLFEKGVSEVIIPLEKANSDEFNAVIEGLFAAQYKFDKYKSEKKPQNKTEIKLEIPDTRKKEFLIQLREIEDVFDGINLCKDLINEPSCVLTPEVFVNRVKELSSKLKLTADIKTCADLKKEGFNGLLTVGKGSPNPPYMVTLTYEGAAKKNPHLVIAGKGVTFDTGGISLKPSSHMWEMKSDMSGAATALGVFYAVVILKLKVRLSVVLVLAENRPSDNAVLPGDIFTAKNGKTVMVENTDAEGRLILTDALAQAEIIGGTHVIDVATLTGSIINALGSSISGIFSNNSQFARTIKSLGAKAGEKFWEMPLEEEYRPWLDDAVADMKNIGKSEAGSITAALFLKEFVSDKTVWAHFDIAGTAFTTKPWKYYGEGPTGFGVKTLVALAKSMQK